ncbi:hypothetical protein ABZ801_33820 [Actinomadura sp. NPDC047616]|uniref:hypothetical protein n=1 Tax=Actinomadura sp. NPDC047616 TaxID=3155914 RepID=UPI00340AFB3D
MPPPSTADTARTTTPAAPAYARPLFWLTVTAITYALTHHVGVAMAWLGTVGPTRWADWIDLLTPYAVLLPTAAALHTGGAGRRTWALYLTGALTYVEGHGIHLAANSVGNHAPSDIAHLWDETAGHYIWYGGVALVVASLAAALAHHPAPHGTTGRVLAHTAALLTGVTFTTNSLEGGTAVMGIAVAAAFTAWGWTARTRLGGVLVTAFASALLLLTAYGLWQGGFPQPSQLGWI